MSDDLGRGLVDWAADRWTALDAAAATAVGQFAVLRNLVDNKDQSGAFNARIAGKNIDVKTIGQEFTIDMENDDDEDIQRKVGLQGQNLAVKEDEEILATIDLATKRQSDPVRHTDFIKAKNDLLAKGVQSGLGVVVSTVVLSDLESELVGAQSGRDVVEKLVGTTILQSNAIGKPGQALDAVLVQATPPAYRVVRAWGPRLRVLSSNGKTVKLRLEEAIAVGELEANRSLALERVAPRKGA